MVTSIILALSIISLFIIVQQLFTKWLFTTKLGVTIPLALIFLGWFLFLIYGIYPPLFDYPIAIIFFLLSLTILLLIFFRNTFHLSDFKISFLDIVVILAVLIFSIWLMFSSLSYSKDAKTLNIGSHLWSDFGAHIPLIRSFSLGYNFPPQFPLFPNENIRYHFLFYFLVGIFEKFGTDLAVGLNILSTLAFFSFGLLIFDVSRTIFGKASIGIVALLLTFLNSSLTFIKFFSEHNPLILQTYKTLWENISPLANAPYDQSSTIATFWSLNIYLNQRHLSLAFAALLIVVLVFYKTLVQKEKPSLPLFILAGILVGLLPYWHSQTFLMITVTSLCLSIAFIRKESILAIIYYLASLALLAIPQIWWLQKGYLGNQAFIQFSPGYLITPPITILKFIFWWFQNLGLTFILLIDAMLIQRKKLVLFYLCFLPLFLLGFLFKFGPDIATNHKFFNFWLIITNMFIAAFLVRIFSYHILGKILATILLLFLTLSGILELFPIKNDHKISINDWQLNPIGNWLVSNTPKNATFLTSNSLYHPVSLAGRKVFLGWPYFAWSSGSDTTSRGYILNSIYSSTDKKEACNLLIQNKLDYVVIEEGMEDSLYWQNKHFFDNNFIQVFKDSEGDINYTIYDVGHSCLR